MGKSPKRGLISAKILTLKFPGGYNSLYHETD